MQSKKVILSAPNGMHARPAGELVKLVKSLDGKITFATNVKEVNATSMLSILSLGLKSGVAFEIKAEGGDEEGNLHRVVEFIESIKE